MHRLFGIFALALGLALFAPAETKAGDFSTSSVTYSTPDFTISGGTRSVSVSDSAFIRFPLVSGANYTVSYERTSGVSNLALAIYDFVAPEGPGDPFLNPAGGSNIGLGGLIATTDPTFTTPNSVSFVSAVNGFGTIELTDFFSNAFGADITLVTDAVTPVPLPAAGLLLAAGIGGLVVMRRRRRDHD